jgi:formamidopyrimidine-DNA glycosylase
VDVRRQAKFIVFELDRGVMTVHLRMTGRLVAGGTESAYTRAVFELSGGRLVFDDVRQFGRVEWDAVMPAALRRLGPDALEISAQELAARLRAKRGRVKALLLDQGFLGGLGNIYVDEILHRAAVHPLARASRLSQARALRVHGAMVEVLAEAIEAGGSSISDYVDGEGRAGSFQLAHQVYGRAGLACYACGATIQRVIVSQRSSCFCPRCQKR